MSRHMAIWIGGLFISFGVNLFLTPHRLLDGGMIGLALIMRYVWGIQTGLAVILLSGPIFLLVWRYNRIIFFNSIYGTLVSSLLIDGLSPIQKWFPFPVLPSALLGGLFVGVGVGIMLRHRTCTGGMDLLAQFLAEKIRWNVGVLIFLLDACVILSGSVVLNLLQILYALLTISAVGLATSVCVANGIPNKRSNLEPWK